jgi:hypothetical protein
MFRCNVSVLSVVFKRQDVSSLQQILSLSAMLISLLLPLIKVEDFTIEVSNDLYMLIDQVQNFNTIKNSNNDYIYFRIIFSALGLVSFYFLGRFYGIFRIQKLKSQFQKESFDGINFYHTNLSEAPFSYFKIFSGRIPSH